MFLLHPRFLVDVFSFVLQRIFISQTTDFHFANYKFSFRKLQISISQTTDFHFANYRFPFRFVPFCFAPFRFANYSKPISNDIAFGSRFNVKTETWRLESFDLIPLVLLEISFVSIHSLIQCPNAYIR